VDVVRNALKNSPTDHAKVLVGFISDMYTKPTVVRGCKSCDDFVNTDNHKAVRFYLYRRAAKHLRYAEGPRLPFPWEMELLIKALYPGTGTETWTTFAFRRADDYEQSYRDNPPASHATGVKRSRDDK